MRKNSANKSKLTNPRNNHPSATDAVRRDKVQPNTDPETMEPDLELDDLDDELMWPDDELYDEPELNTKDTKAELNALYGAAAMSVQDFDGDTPGQPSFDSKEFVKALEHESARLESLMAEINAAKNLAKARFGFEKDTTSYELVVAINYLSSKSRQFKRAVDAAESVIERHGI